MISRRKFSQSLALSLTAGMSGITSLAQNSNTTASTKLLNDFPAFDLHSHPGLFGARGQTSGYPGDAAVAKTINGMVEGQLSGAFFATVSDLNILQIGSSGVSVSRNFEPGEAWQSYQAQLAALRELLQVNPATITTNPDSITPQSTQVAAFIACEGGDFIEREPERLEQCYADGVRSIQLVHYAQNELGDLQTRPAKFGGLSGTGRSVIAEMNRLGMLIDLAHASFDTAKQAAEISSMPMILSHSQLKRAGHQHPRLLDKDHARLMAQLGGVIGMWPSGFGNDSFADFVDNTLRLIDLVGVDHVGLGTDMDGNYKPVFNDYRQLPDWAGALLARGLSTQEVGKVVGGNAVRVIKQAIG
jgi:membrane dipeptidase